MDLTLESARKQFPVLKKCLYANTATSGLLYEDLLEWRQEHDLDFLFGGGDMKMASMGILGETKEALAGFFNCDRESVALVPNFSIGWNFLFEGLDKKSKILLLETDYPSVNWPVEDRGFECHYVKISNTLEEAIFDVVREKKIDVLVLSVVQWATGLFITLDFFKKLKMAYPDLLIVADGTQFCGMYGLDFGESGIDVLGASGYKWMLGGYGNGFFLFSETAVERFRLKSVGCGSVNGDPTKRNGIPFKKQLEPGHLDSFNFGSLKFSIAFLERIGIEKITAHNQKIAQLAKEGFSDLGILNDITQKRNKHSTIFNLKLNDAQFQALLEKEISCAQRAGGVRFSFHFYNTIEDIELVLRTLNQTLRMK
ncbi:aminotransferase class V-fold PLP-dependent enzyme [Croceivirga thetidis]|uniref:Aminotransferase class V-fold PLP-dependent enzyme n=1 Tax=Croceivirga thetidis TaxID=2721623 RepID=A0ABX1GL21_9FLAO|nr:aminotransferase class V-fold PLP-dependent enzyme [Croceivirga thetidis]NKI30549.1 aminotransferase class V-fold PLP-dependent enzyme [Croceivirga thetidis]